jgi:hypothetical protein
MQGDLGSGVMTLTLGERYTITYRERGEERTALVHYRGFGTADSIARGDPAQSPSGEAGELHWFQLDGVPGYLTIREEDLLDYEVAEPYG